MLGEVSKRPAGGLDVRLNKSKIDKMPAFLLNLLNTYLYQFKQRLDRKACFARVCAARGWSPAYQGPYIHPPHQFYPLDPT